MRAPLRRTHGAGSAKLSGPGKADMPGFRYRLFLADGTDVGEASYAFVIKLGDVSTSTAARGCAFAHSCLSRTPVTRVTMRFRLGYAGL